MRHHLSVHTEFTRTLGIEAPLICGAMYPCSNPELVAAKTAASELFRLFISYLHGRDGE
jgi:nitronate monooxygenase